MNALFWTEKNRLELCEAEEPRIAVSGQVKVKISMAGICGTDLAVITGKELGTAGVIRGHEAVGTVVEIGEQVYDLNVGDRVVIDPNQSCGQCHFCRKGQPNLCVGKDGKGFPIAGLNVHGTFAPYFVSEQQFVYRIPDSMTWETGVLVEPLACVLHNFREALVTPFDSVLVLGSGPMGLLCQMVAKKFARLTVATEINPYRLAIARTIADCADTPERLAEMSVVKALPNSKFDVIIDTVGTQMETAERWIDRGGRIVPFGINSAYSHTITPTKYIQNGIKIVAAGEYRYLFGTALEFAAALPGIERLVTHRYKIEQHERAINELLGYDLATRIPVKCEALKTVFQPHHSTDEGNRERSR